MVESQHAYQLVYSADVNNDGIVDTQRYASRICIPREIKPLDGGRKKRVATFPTLDGGNVILTQTRAGTTDQRAPGAVVLTWEHVPETFRHLVEEDYAKDRLVSMRLDHRWRCLEVISSGLTDKRVTVLAGHIRQDSDTYWLDSDTIITCDAAHTVVYASLANGVVSIGSGIDGSGEESGDAVPEGAVILAEISIAGNIVTVVSNPSGVANPRTGYITDLEILPAVGGGVGLSLTLQEVW